MPITPIVNGVEKMVTYLLIFYCYIKFSDLSECDTFKNKNISKVVQFYVHPAITNKFDFQSVYASFF